jgi:hypothetical protein
MGLDFRDHTYRRYVVLGKRTVKDGEALHFLFGTEKV